jgi:hypothetical protein
LYIRKIVVGIVEPKDEISAIIKFVPLADVCKVTSMEDMMPERIKGIFLAHLSTRKVLSSLRGPDVNTFCLELVDVVSGAFLRDSYALRNIFACIAMEGYLRSDDHKFVKETREVSDFAVDVLKAVNLALKTAANGNCGPEFTDTLSGTKCRFGQVDLAIRERDFQYAGSQS